jgi:hypothetical protein
MLFYQSDFSLQAVYFVSMLLIRSHTVGLGEMEMQMAWKKENSAVRDSVPFYFVEIKLLLNPHNINI